MTNVLTNSPWFWPPATKDLSAQNRAYQNFIMERRAHEVPLLAERVLTVNSGWGRAVPFLSGIDTGKLYIASQLYSSKQHGSHIGKRHESKWKDLKVEGEERFQREKEG